MSKYLWFFSSAAWLVGTGWLVWANSDHDLVSVWKSVGFVLAGAMVVFNFFMGMMAFGLELMEEEEGDFLEEGEEYLDE